MAAHHPANLKLLEQDDLLWTNEGRERILTLMDKARGAAITECALTCDDIERKYREREEIAPYPLDEKYGAMLCADSIRELLSTTPTPSSEGRK